MNKQDRDSLLSLGFIGALVLLSVVSVKLMENFSNVILPAILLVVIQQVYVIPKFCRDYYEVFDVECNFKRFLPIYNDSLVCPPVGAYIYFASVLLCTVSVVVMFLPASIFGSTMEPEKFLWLKDMSIYTMILAVIIICITRGIGYASAISNIQDRLEDVTGEPSNVWDIVILVSYIVVFIPGLRSIAILYQMTFLTNILEHDEYLME